MSHIPALRPKEVEQVLLKAGFVRFTAKGSHRTYQHPEKKRYTSVSFHPGTIPSGTLRAIIKQSGMTVDEFLSYR